MRHFFRVLRRWNQPTIEVNLSAEALSLTMEQGSFADALCAAIGSPFFILTKRQLRHHLGHALLDVMDEMKATTKGIAA